MAINKKSILYRIQNQIAYRGLTVSQFANLMGVSRSTMSRLLNGHSDISLEFLDEMADFFEVEIYDFLYDDEKARKQKEAEYGKYELVRRILYQNPENLLRLEGYLDCLDGKPQK